LTGRIPDLKLDGLVIDEYRPRAKFNANRQIMLVFKPLVGELQ
jgi:hypothetical protein